MSHTRADELTVVKLLTADYTPGFIAQANKMLEADVQQIANKYGWPDKNRLAYAVDELTAAADANEQRRIPTRRDPETVPSVRAKPKVVATTLAFGKPAAAAGVGDAGDAGEPESGQERARSQADDDDQDEPALVAELVDGELKPVRDASPQTLGALVFRASGSDSKRTQSLGKRITELATELAERLDAEEQERQAREEQEQERAAVAAELAAAEKALAEAREKARQLRGGKPATVKASASVQRDHDPKAVRAWAAAMGIVCPDRGRVPGHVVDLWRQARGDGAA